MHTHGLSAPFIKRRLRCTKLRWHSRRCAAWCSRLKPADRS